MRTIALCLFATIALSTIVVAHETGFGRPVRPSGPDHIPVTQEDSIAVEVLEADFGEKGVARDNCLLIDLDASGAGATTDDLRLTACFGREPGSAIDDEATTERHGDHVPVATARVQWVDTDTDGAYGEDDYVYVTSHASPGLVATAATGSWTARLAGPEGTEPGSFVFTNDPDYVAYAATAQLLTASLAERNDGAWFLVPRAAGFPAGSVVPVSSVRLSLEAANHVEEVLVAPAPVRPAAPFQVTVRFADAAPGTVVETRMEGSLVDVRALPAGRREVTFTLLAPTQEGTVQLSVNGFERSFVVTLSGGAGPEGTGDGEGAEAAGAGRETGRESAKAAVPAMGFLAAAAVVVWASRRRA